jgi:hypothetical protein
VQVLPLTFVLKIELSARQNLTQSQKTLAERLKDKRLTINFSFTDTNIAIA